MARLSVLVCSEGTYPFYPGGVSVWCHQLVHLLSEIDFRLFAITHAPNRKSFYQIPGNVVGVDSLSLWGTDEPGLQNASFSETYRRKNRTSSDVIRSEFLGAFTQVAECIVRGGGAPQKLGDALTVLHLYFKQYDFAKTMISPEAWQVFLTACERHFPESSELSIHDATTCMRWMQRFLGVLAVPFPVTDITHSSMSGLASIPGIINKVLNRTPFVLTEHGIYIRELYLSLMRSGYSDHCRRFLLGFNQAFTEMNYHYADVITALGNFNKAWQVQLGAPPSKIRITPNGTDPDRFRPRKQSPRDKLVVVTMARIYYLKGIEFLLRAAAIVRSRIPSVLFRVLGDVADPAYFRECEKIISEYNLEKNVEFGATKDPATVLAESDIFCLPSVSEGMPYSILEAMFSACPVVATDVGNVAEMLGGTGIVVPPADPESLARALLSLLDGEGASNYRRLLAQSALNRAQSLYTTNQAVNRFREIYHSLTYARTASKVHIATA